VEVIDALRVDVTQLHMGQPMVCFQHEFSLACYEQILDLTLMLLVCFSSFTKAISSCGVSQVVDGYCSFKH
jgi:hypothetical protein